MVQLPTEFRAALDSYQGPLDLLLYLIKKDEVDILDIPIARITEQYLSYLAILKTIDPNACGEFLVVAANLMEIKSRSLLPTEPALADAPLDDPRIELVRQLLEYKKYKERALLLARRIDEHSRRFHRAGVSLPDLPVEEIEGPLDLGNVSVWDLLTAFHRIQLSLGQRGPHRVLFEERPLESYIASVQEIAGGAEGRRILFDELLGGSRDIYDAIGYFLAILEMAKRRLLGFRQEEPFGPIEIVLRDPVEEPAAQEADPSSALLPQTPGGPQAPAASGVPPPA